MTTLPRRKTESTRSKAPVRQGRPLPDDQPEVLRDVWTYPLASSAGDGQSAISASFKLHSFALHLCYPRAGKWSSTKPLPYQRYAHDPTLRPWATDGEKQLVFVILSAMQWDETAGVWR